MPKKKIKAVFTASWEFEIEYEDQSPEFKRALKEYSTAINKGGDAKSMLEHCIFNYALRGTRDVEGVGVIEVDGFNHSFHKFDPAGISLKTIMEEETEYEFNPEP